MKRHLLALMVALALSACSDPRDIEVAKLTKEQTEQLEKKLNGEEARLLMGYQLRRGMSQALDGKPAPEGVTVKQAIADQREWLERQKQEELIAAEKRKQEEARAAELKKKLDEEQRVRRAEFDKLLSVALLSKRNVEQSYGQRFTRLEIAYENKGQKDILGVKGVLHLKDIFDDKIMDIRWSYDGGVAAGKTAVEKGAGIEINQFRDVHMKLWNTDADKIKATFDVDTIIFKDGTKIEAPK